jgi:DNA-binding NarL/FixJ family response regulator
MNSAELSIFLIMGPIRILLASHQPVVRSSLRALLEQEPDFHVLAEAASGREAIAVAECKRPDIVVLDTKLPLVSAIAAAEQTSSSAQSPSAVFLSANTDRCNVHEAFRAGVRAYVDHDSAATDLARAIRVAARGGLFLSPSICSRLFEPHLRKGNISEYEKTLWCLIAAGYEEHEIANMMNIDSKRVRLDSRSLKSLFCLNSLPEVMAHTNRAVSSSNFGL